MGKAGLTLPIALLVWVIAAATGISAFSALFEQGRYAMPTLFMFHTCAYIDARARHPTPTYVRLQLGRFRRRALLYKPHRGYHTVMIDFLFLLCSTTGPQGIPLLGVTTADYSGCSLACCSDFGVLTLNSVMAVYHSKGGGEILAFVATSYVDLLLLFCCLWLYKSSVQGSPLRNRLKASVWTLTTLLTFSFAYMVMGTADLTLPLALLVWAIAAATGIGAFAAFFEQAR
ncbi:hypothetical protein ACQ4PT_055565 [Festuca glaucescens]